jgi:hypothetical protein
MTIYFYLSLFPEALIASMLPPDEFGRYMSTGTTKRESRQEAIYFELDRAAVAKAFDLSDLEKRCVPHPNGDPKATVYYSIYRVLERLPLEAFKDLYLSTKGGKVLGLKRSAALPRFKDRSFFYQEMAPVYPRIVSTLDPEKFTKFITDKNTKLFIPRLCFADLRLGALADNPQAGSSFDLPYTQLDNLRKCLMEIQSMPDKPTKTVDRMHPSDILFRTINNGFFVGSYEALLFYPFPSEKELNSTYYEWYRSATQ